MMKIHRPTVDRVAFNAATLEHYRKSRYLLQRDMAEIARMAYASYCDWLKSSYAPAKKVHVLRHIEKVCDLDLEIEVMPAMSRDEAMAWAREKYEAINKKREEQEELTGLLLYPKDCQRCCWRRGAMCLTPLCMKRGNEYDPTMAWGGHLEIYRGTNKS